MKKIEKLMRRGSEFLGVEYPIICGAMTWVSDPKLVSAVCNAGGFGCLAGGNTPVEILERQIEETRELTDKNFAVNLITLAPLYKEHLKMIERTKPKYVVFAGGLPKRKDIELAKSVGAKTICFAPTIAFARRLISWGADALVLEGMEAGGHIGPVGLVVLLQQILFEIKEVPVFVGGGIAKGKMMAHLMMMGAAGVQLGTRFVLARECSVHQSFKDSFIRAGAKDAIATPQFDSRLPVVSVRALKNEGMKKFSKLQMALIKELESKSLTREDAQMKVEEFWVGALREAAIDGDTTFGSLMAGQSVGLVESEMSVKEIIDELVRDGDSAVSELINIL